LDEERKKAMTVIGEQMDELEETKKKQSEASMQ
jgi:hypothetical protein